MIYLGWLNALVSRASRPWGRYSDISAAIAALHGRDARDTERRRYA